MIKKIIRLGEEGKIMHHVYKNSLLREKMELYLGMRSGMTPGPWLCLSSHLASRFSVVLPL